MSDSSREREAKIEAVRRAALLLAAAQDHFRHLLSTLSPEERSEFQSGNATPTPSSERIEEKRPRRPRVTRHTRTKPTLKETVRTVVTRNPEGLTLPQLIDAVLLEYTSPRSSNQRHVVRTAINQMVRTKGEPVVWWDEEKKLFVTAPF
jgi:hypothetical protein